ncbi:phospholipase D-like domain-containing protein [Deinococcus sp. Leaf326]|uniref:phospholipase D-like domain-containing protein n=1 Tax=Deinococcus sp. Leaf326 TaxID=1736338 RepID=UPI0006F99042|nr:phospholipase D-like domain-containing protein [Deinococcus sp. Leaf326]KQR36001.1 phospholipase [Deinococcus sp. Leaf326]
MRRSGSAVRGAALAALLLPGVAGGAAFPVGLGPVPAAAPLLAPACAAPIRPLDLSLWRVATADGRPDLSCSNAFVGYLRTPRGPGTPQDAFEVIAEQVRAAHNEVLLTSMEWQGGQGRPGYTFASAVRDLYARVRAGPAAYPQGMRVRVVLGGYPDFVRLDGAAQALALARDLRVLGVPLEDAALDWHVSVLNYGFFPHSHAKLHVIDGQDVTVEGYNFADGHLPEGENGGRGLHDLGLRMRGPAAQDAVAAFDDLWRHSRQLRCPAGVAAAEVAARCALGLPDPPSHPAVARAAVPAGDARAFVLYRRPGSDVADRAQQALFLAARRSIDLLEVDFSPELACWSAYQNPEGCGRTTFPPYFAALLDAMERGVRVRVLTVNYSYGAYANRSGVALLRYEARRRGLDALFEARYVDFKLHSKVVTVDREMVVAGSVNFHFSSWGPLGLNEAVLATSDPAAVAEQQASFEDLWTKRGSPVPDEWWLRFVKRQDGLVGPGPADER